MAVPDSGEWEIFYYDLEISGRNEFIKYIFEEAGVKYKNVYDNVPELFKGEQWTGYPTFAPPMIKNGEFTLSQTAVICRFLGQKFGLYPDGEINAWHAEQLNATIHDYLAEGRLAFHGVNHTASYHTQTEETKPYIARFESERLPKFLRHFEKALGSNDGGNGFLIGKHLTYVDLALFQVLRATENQFPSSWANLTDIPLLKSFKQRVEARPNIASFLKSPRCRKFCGDSMM